jgi:hypothetical protein
MTRESGHGGGCDQQAVLLVAGLADLAVSTMGSAVGMVRGLLRRSDAAELYAAVPPAHLEVLARHALARRAGDGG